MKTLAASMVLILLALNVVAQHNDITTFHFSENKGQLHPDVKYHAKLHVGDVYLQQNKFVFDMYSADELDEYYKLKHDPKARKNGVSFDRSLKKHAYNMEFVGANMGASLNPENQIEGYKNYFIGKDQSKWTSNVKSYTGVRYKEMYPDIDLEIYTVFERMKYDFIVKAGGDPNNISIKYNGVESMEIVEGALLIHLSTGDIKEMKPIAFQDIDGERHDVRCKFELDDNAVSFVFPDGYDTTQELTIDPTWIFSTLTGSASDNWGFTATYDTTGNLYSGGIAFGTLYPTTVGAYSTTFAGGTIDIAISKFTADGTGLIYSTYIGGSDNEVPHSIVVDSQDNLVVLGSTGSSNFPTTAGAYDNTFNGGTSVTFSGITYGSGSDIALFKFNNAGTALIGSTYIGGLSNDGLNEAFVHNYSDEVRGEVVVTDSDEIVITTSTRSANFPATIGAYSATPFGGQDAVVVKMAGDLTSMSWGTFLGGTNDDAGYSIRMSPSDDVYVCGGTNSTNLGTTAGVIGATYYGGTNDGFVGSLSGASGTLIDLSYLGTAQYDQSFILEIDNVGDVYVTGQSTGPYPTVSAAYSNPNSGQFIHKMDASFSSTAYSTVFGGGNVSAGSGTDISLTAFLVDNCGNVYVSGWGGTTNNSGSTTGLPITGDAQQSTTDGSDFYFFVMERNATSLLYGTYFGSASAAEHVDGGTSRFDKAGNVYQAVCAGCGGNPFPTTPGVWSTSNGSTNCNLGAIKFELDFQGITNSATSPGDQTLCASPFDVDFVGDAVPNHYWDFGDGSGTSTAPNPTYTYADTGFYNVMYVAIDSSTCNIADTVYFDITLIQPEVFSASIDIPPVDPCAAPDSLLVDLEFTGSGADSISWNMGDGTIYTNDTLINHYYTSQGVYYIEMIAYDFLCMNTDTILDTVNYVANFTTVSATPPPDQELCFAPFNVDFTGDAVPNHYWDFGDGIGTSTSATPSYTYSDSGSYQVMYVAIDSSTCNISDTAYFNVSLTIAETLTADFNLPTVEPCTSPDSLEVILTFTGSGADSLYWDMGDGTTFIDSSSISYYYTTQGVFPITLSAWDFTCGQFMTFTDTLDFTLSYSTAVADASPNILACDPPFDVTFSGGSPAPPESFWDFDDGNTSTVNSPTHTFTDTGHYDIMYVAIDSSTCNIADTVWLTVDILEAEVFAASLDFDPPPPCGSDTMWVDLAFTGSGADSLSWDMGDGTIIEGDTSVVYYYTVPGVYTISLYAEDTLCNKSETVNNTVVYSGNPNSSVIVPNVFTPNGDGKNDEILFSGVDPTADFTWTVFNRWGTPIFESVTQGQAWDGTNQNNGNELESGIYFYELFFKDLCEGEEKLLTGYIHLIR